MRKRKAKFSVDVCLRNMKGKRVEEARQIKCQACQADGDGGARSAEGSFTGCALLFSLFSLLLLLYVYVYIKSILCTLVALL